MHEATHLRGSLHLRRCLLWYIWPTTAQIALRSLPAGFTSDSWSEVDFDSRSQELANDMCGLRAKSLLIVKADHIVTPLGTVTCDR
jgi:hypothetical protein